MARTPTTIKIGRILKVELDRSQFTVHRFTACTVHKGSVKRTEYHPRSAKYRALYLQEGEEILRPYDANEATINKTSTRRNKAKRADPITTIVKREVF